MTRPYVILNAAMTLDGKIATIAGDSKIKNPDLIYPKQKVYIMIKRRSAE